MARLSLSLLGPPQVTLGGSPVTGFAYDKVRALLAYLALEADRPHRRDALVGLLWPDLPEQAARNNLRQALANLRQAIGDHAAQLPFLLLTRETIQFNPTSDHWLDVAVFTDLLAACDSHPHRHPETCKPCAQRLEQATTLYRGSFLEGFFLPDSVAFDEWAVLKREGLQHRAIEALTRLATYHEHRGAYELAYHAVARLLEIDPLREEAHRQLMRVLTLSGQRNAALAQYERCRHLLAEELGVEPEAETTTLYQRIRYGAAEQGGAGAGAPGDSSGRPRLRSPAPLPVALTPFIDREAELAMLMERLSNSACRLITVVGPGGIGKSRLVLQAAAEQAGTYVHGVAFVPLAPVSSADFMIPAIADALRYSFYGSVEPKVQLLNYLHEKEVLLVLDNVEHLLVGAELLADVLQHAPAVTILATSRERLNLQGELVVEVQGLSCPKYEQIDGMEDYAAVRLFLQCARRVHSGFDLMAESVSVIRICRLVEGMPLGIELASSWVPTLTCADIAHEIEQNLAFLTTSLRDVPTRHRSLRAVFDHSWNLLSEEERRAFRQLSVFQGGFLRDAAEQVAGATLPLLAALVDKSLMYRDTTGRYNMHELVRQYANERLRETEEMEWTLGRHLEYYLALAEAAEPQRHGAERQLWLERLEVEHDNLRAALAWSMTADGTEAGLRLAGALSGFWYMKGYWSEGRDWIERALAKTKGLGQTLMRAKALFGGGELARDQGDYDRATALFEERLALGRELKDSGCVAWSLYELGMVAVHQSNYERAMALFGDSLTLFRELKEIWGTALSLYGLALVALQRGDDQQATPLCLESLALCRELEAKGTSASVLNCLGIIAEHEGAYDRAATLYTESLMLYREEGNKDGIAWSLRNLGSVAQHQGAYERAAALYMESLVLREELGDKDGVAWCLEGLMGVALGRGQAVHGARLGGAAEALREAIGAHMPPDKRTEYDRTLAAIHAQLTESAFVAAWAEGHAMSLEQAIAYALARSNRSTQW
jgi:predicted ATPase